MQNISETLHKCSEWLLRLCGWFLGGYLLAGVWDILVCRYSLNYSFKPSKPLHWQNYENCKSKILDLHVLQVQNSLPWCKWFTIVVKWLHECSEWFLACYWAVAKVFWVVFRWLLTGSSLKSLSGILVCRYGLIPSFSVHCSLFSPILSPQVKNCVRLIP